MHRVSISLAHRQRISPRLRSGCFNRSFAYFFNSPCKLNTTVKGATIPRRPLQFPFAAGTVTGHERTHPASSSSAHCQATAAPRFPDCTPPSETCLPCRGTTRRHQSVSEALSAAPDTADRSPAHTVLSAMLMCRATWRAAALSQPCPTASLTRRFTRQLRGASERSLTK